MDLRLFSCASAAIGALLLAPATMAQYDDSENYDPTPGGEYGSAYEPIRKSVFASEMEDPYQPNLITPMGMSATIGGGVTGFTDAEARDFSEVGGGWDLRLALGTRNIIGGELAYIGSSQNVTALGLDDSAFLQAHGGEIAGRLHLLPGVVQPYLLVGAGFTRYILTNEDFNTSSISGVETVAHFPLGVGTSFRYRGFLADARGVFRPVADGDLFSQGSEMHTWGANLSLGTEF